MFRQTPEYRDRDEYLLGSRPSTIKISSLQESQQSIKSAPQYLRNHERLSLQAPQQQFFTNNLSNQNLHKATSASQIAFPKRNSSSQYSRKSVLEAPSPFYISSEQLSQYEKYASSIDKEGKGIIEGSQVREVFMKSKLTIPMLKQIWALLDTTKKGFLTRYEFIGMVHIVRLCSNGIRIPLTLPSEIKELLVMHTDYSEPNNLNLSRKTSLEMQLNQNTRMNQLDKDQVGSTQKYNNINGIKESFGTQQSDYEEDDSDTSTHFTSKKDIQQRQNSQRLKNSKNLPIGLKNTQNINENRFSFAQQFPNYQQDNRNQSPIEFHRSSLLTPNSKDSIKKQETPMLHIEHSSVLGSATLNSSMDQADTLAEVIQAFRETTKKVEEKNARLQKSLTKIKKFEKHSMKKLEEIGNQFSRTVANNNELSKELVNVAKYSIEMMTEKAQEILEKNRSLIPNQTSQKPWEASNEQDFLSSYPNLISSFNGIQS